MAKSRKRPKSAKNSKQQSKPVPVAWIVRIGAVVLLLIFAIVLYTDFAARRDAVDTASAWLQLLATANEEQKDLAPDELLPHLIGDPDVEGDLGEGDTIYTWSSLIRSFSAKVTCEQAGEEMVVLEVEGPKS